MFYHGVNEMCQLSQVYNVMNVYHSGRDNPVIEVLTFFLK